MSQGLAGHPWCHFLPTHEYSHPFPGNLSHFVWVLERWLFIVLIVCVCVSFPLRSKLGFLFSSDPAPPRHLHLFVSSTTSFTCVSHPPPTHPTPGRSPLLNQPPYSLHSKWDFRFLLILRRPVFLILTRLFLLLVFSETIHPQVIHLLPTRLPLSNPSVSVQVIHLVSPESLGPGYPPLSKASISKWVDPYLQYQVISLLYIRSSISKLFIPHPHRHSCGADHHLSRN